MQQGDYEAAIAASQAVLDSGTADPIQRDHALLNLVAANFNSGHGEIALDFARNLEAATVDPNIRAIAEMSQALILVQTEGDLDSINRRLRSMAASQREKSSHYYGVTMLNLALNSVVQDRLDDALGEVAEAVDALEATTGAIEQSAAGVLRTAILLRLGRIDEAKAFVPDLEAGAAKFIPYESFADAADAFDSYGSRVVALSILDRVGDASTQTLTDRRMLALARARMAIRRRDASTAAAELETYPLGLSPVVGSPAALRMTQAHLAVISGDAHASILLAEATDFAASMGATSTRRIGELLIATLLDPDVLGNAVAVVGDAAPWHLTFLAEDLVPHLPRLDSEAVALVHEAALRHPERWRTALRQVLEQDGRVLNVQAAQLLEAIGEQSDIARLRRLARSARRKPDANSIGRGLARRLAERVRLEDQGRVAIQIGQRVVLGSSIRRKVLAMLCYLITRPDMSATRDQVLDALWPELDPEVSVNSLNQTIYFLRRVFEEGYSEDLSPGYVHHDSDVVWLDTDLISSRSAECRQLIRDLPNQPSPDDVDRLTMLYRGRFALDFEYEDWATAYRDPLHAAYLEIVERSVFDDFRSGHYDRGIWVARRALDVDPSAEQIEVCLLRLYRVTGAHAAAAEQYAHYANVMRDELGLEPPPLDDL
jgi:DNA-binding SARP family transcriptional activator